MNASQLGRSVPVGASARIAQRQNEEQHLKRLRAYSRLYLVGQRWRRARALGTIALAAVGPLISLLMPDATDLVAAISAGWLVLGRTALTWLEQRATQQAVRVQELYDTSLFDLPWNTALVGQQPSHEDVAAAARRIADNERFRDWYSIELADTPWPADVLLCQRQSMVWSRQDHRSYSATIATIGLAWFIIGVAVAILKDLSLADYLIKMFLPSAPAFLDTIELSQLHWRHANSRQQVEHKIDDLWKQHSNYPGSLSVNDCREVQDASYLLRRDGPRVPRAFYSIRRAASDANTKEGTAALLEGGAVGQK